MVASGAYQCSGCSVMFTDPAAWRSSAVTSAPTPPAYASYGVQCIDEADLRANRGAGGMTEADNKAIREAAARINKGKGRGW